jgi:hypothetical protein
VHLCAAPQCRHVRVDCQRSERFGTGFAHKAMKDNHLLAKVTIPLRRARICAAQEG